MVSHPTRSFPSWEAGWLRRDAWAALALGSKSQSVPAEGLWCGAARAWSRCGGGLRHWVRVTVEVLAQAVVTHAGETGKLLH